MQKSKLQTGEDNDNSVKKKIEELIAVHVPVTTINSLKKEFNILEAELNNFITCLIDRAVTEHIAEANSTIFSDSEVKELEDDLKGLGYI